MENLSDYLSGKIIQWLEKKVKENPWYQKLTGNIVIVASNNSELNRLLEEAIKTARTNEIAASLRAEDIIESININIDIISEWIVFPKDHLPISSFLYRINYANSNEEHCKQIDTFYKSLYEQIHDNKENYQTLQNIQIQKELGTIREEMNSGFSSINSKMDQLLAMAVTDYEKLKFNDELTAIENKIKSRQFTLAREAALILEEKISKNGNKEETEKLYALIINTYLLQGGGRQEGALDYFDKLIANTQNDRKKKARGILRQIISKDFKNAQMELDKIFLAGKDEKIELIFYENQINLYLISGGFDAGYNFVINNKEIIHNYQYFLALMLVQQSKFEDANNLFEEHKDFFCNTDFEIQEIKILIRSHALLDKLRKMPAIEVINELKELSAEIKTLIAAAGDCETKISYLLSINAIILAAVFEREAAKNEYERALELDPNNYNVHKNYPLLLLDSPENMEKALGFIQKYFANYPYSLDDELLYYSILTEIDPRRAIDEITARKDEKIEIQVYLVYALDRTNQHKKAESLLNEILEKHNDFSAHFCAGWHYLSVNEPDIAIESFMKAYSLCSNETHYDSVFYYLLKVICSKHNLEKMAVIRNWLEERYKRPIILLKYPQQYIHILVVLGDYETCLACCKALRENDVSEDYIAYAEFSCHYNTQNFQKVKQVLDENRIQYSDDILIRMAHACAVIGEYDQTKEILVKVKKPQTKEEYIIHTQLLFTVKEFQSSLKTIHNAYLNYPDDRSIQEIFIKLVFVHHIQPQTDDIIVSFRNCVQSYTAADYNNKILHVLPMP